MAIRLLDDVEVIGAITDNVTQSDLLKFLSEGNVESLITDFLIDTILFFVNLFLVSVGMSKLDTTNDLLDKGLFFLDVSSLKVLIEFKLILEGSSINII